MTLKTKLIWACALCAAVFLGYNLVTVGNAQNTPHDKREIENIVKQYLLDHPEVIVEALDLYYKNEVAHEEAAAEVSLASNLEELLDPRDGYVAGTRIDEAQVAVIELFDYHCSYCKKANNYMNELARSDDGVAVIFRELPILREESEYAAQIALAARDQGKYLQFHSALMKARGVLSKERIDKIAKNIGLDLQALHLKHTQKPATASLARTRKIAVEAGITGTPAFIVASIDGRFIRVISGWKPEHVDAAIEEARKIAN